MDAHHFRSLVEGAGGASLPQPSVAEPDNTSVHRVSVQLYQVPNNLVSHLFLPSAPSEPELADFESKLKQELADEYDLFFSQGVYPDPSSADHQDCPFEAGGENKSQPHCYWFGSAKLVPVPTEEGLQAKLDHFFATVLGASLHAAQVEIGTIRDYVHVQFTLYKKASSGRLSFNLLKDCFSRFPALFAEPVWLRFIPEGDFQRCARYCQKEDTFAGVRSVNMPAEKHNKRGNRSDLDRLADYLRQPDVMAMPRDHQLRAVSAKFTSAFMRYSKGIKEAIDALAPRSTIWVPKEPLPWQAELLDILCLPPDPIGRTIHYVWCLEGNTGKSTLSDLVEVRGIPVYNVTSGNVGDIAHAYDSQPVVFFDLTRACDKHIRRSFFHAAECLKNGRLFSPKYQSCEKRFLRPHVVFFSNQPYSLGFSADRVRLWDLNGKPKPVPHIDNFQCYDLNPTYPEVQAKRPKVDLESGPDVCDD